MLPFVEQKTDSNSALFLDDDRTAVSENDHIPAPLTITNSYKSRALSSGSKSEVVECPQKSAAVINTSPCDGKTISVLISVN